MKIDGKDTDLVVIYRPPNLSKKSFLEEFERMICEHFMNQKNIIICGDFNLNFLDKNDSYMRKCCDILDMFDLVQNVSIATHQSGTAIDWIITRKENKLIQRSPSAGSLISDHFAVIFELTLPVSNDQTKTISYRKYKDINLDQFKKDISNLDIVKSPPGDLDSLVHDYNKQLAEVLDQHAPVVTKTLRNRQNRAWYDQELRSLKQEVRKQERFKNKLCDSDTSYRNKYNVLKTKYNKLLSTKKAEFYNSKISEHESDQKQLFKIVDNLKNKKRSNPLPDHSSRETLANDFASYFKTKIDKITDSFTPVDTTCDTNCTEIPIFSAFQPLSLEQTKTLIRSSASKSCILDPLPTFLVKSCVEELGPVIMDIVNRSLTTGYMPELFKSAIVTPLLKKTGLDRELKNYRPVSNLAYVSKLIEKTVTTQINYHCEKHGLDESLQSAYRKHHSTESALLKVHNDIMMMKDKGKVILLALLDLSAAFDTVNHDILIERLQRDYGISDTAAKWFNSYLRDRDQKVVIGDAFSGAVALETGVPQGSGGGPGAYTRYTRNLGTIIRDLMLLFHLFADDTQLYQSVDPGSIISQNNGRERMENGISEIGNWMNRNRLKLNKEKTEFLMIGTSQQLRKMQYSSIRVAGDVIECKSSVRNLGSFFDNEMKMHTHVHYILKCGYYQLRQLNVIRRCLTSKTATTLIVSIIFSKLDYCNALLYGIPDGLLTKLQKLQNACARFVTKRRKFDSISDALRELHWLPVRARIEFKILVWVYKCLNGNAPVYLVSLLSLPEQSRSRREVHRHNLKVPRTTRKYGGDRAFCVAGPKLWNELPYDVKQCSSLSQFRKKLKTYLFTQYYGV